MRATVRALGMGFVAGVLVVGCSGSAPEPPGDDASAGGTGGADQAAENHTHDGDDVLFWQREGIEEKGYQIRLGHHGVHVNAGHRLEPAVSISFGGEPVADAKVFNSLIAIDSEQVLATEVAAVYEPPTEAEPAHYAQGEIDVPQDLQRATIRYRIVLPGDAGEVIHDVPVLVSSH